MARRDSVFVFACVFLLFVHQSHGSATRLKDALKQVEENKKAFAPRAAESTLQPGGKVKHWLENEAYAPLLGKHWILELHGCDPEVIKFQDKVMAAVEVSVASGNATLINQWGHQFSPWGTTTLALLSESHVSVHTWPEHGYAAADVFTCGDIAKPDEISRGMEKGFGCDPKKTVWSFNARGGLTGVTDLDTLHQTRMQKELVAHVLSRLHSIHVYDVAPTDHVWSGAVQASGRVLYLDGTLRTSQSDEFIYHETLVHTAMLSHPNPKTVVIIGGGEGSAAREVLKHDSVEKVVIVELDPVVTAVAKVHLKDFHQGALDDRRVELVFAEGSFYLQGLDDGSVDVVIIDVLHIETSDKENARLGRAIGQGTAQEQYEFPLYAPGFYHTLRNKLDPKHGVAITNGGAVNLLDSVKDLSACEACNVAQQLAVVFPSVSMITTNVPSFMSPVAFVLASVQSPAPDTFTSGCAAAVDEALEQRVSAPLRSYDGAQHENMLMLPKQLRDHIHRHSTRVLNVPPRKRKAQPIKIQHTKKEEL